MESKNLADRGFSDDMERMFEESVSGTITLIEKQLTQINDLNIGTTVSITALDVFIPILTSTSC